MPAAFNRSWRIWESALRGLLTRKFGLGRIGIAEGADPVLHLADLMPETAAPPQPLSPADGGASCGAALCAAYGRHGITFWTGAMMPNLSLRSFSQPTVLLAMALMAVVAMMVLPVPAWVLDIGLALSFALAILMFTVTLFVERPLDFSAFPTILLASLMLRLSLNVSSTKLIIGNGHTGTDAAGHVIEGFANFIMGGNLLLGLVIFCVLLIVNFMVITKGAGRMAEVGGPLRAGWDAGAPIGH